MENKETLEEAILNSKEHNDLVSEDGTYISLHKQSELLIKGGNFGAKWQQERMYSEEEVGELVYNIIGEYAKHYDIMIDGAKLNELFKQFKKEIR
jgi:hypothetical protein